MKRILILAAAAAVATPANAMTLVSLHGGIMASPAELGIYGGWFASIGIASLIAVMAYRLKGN